eukprot:CAMPEP_0171180422 /NCGR_PEP_ID=MMETSP0790-20130122/13748_1 /TAXON_ID=2925 /ORGANISM="Alexandrium catenella, Strain OF101" /LENGTH=334 /DNA_ID=CAMNT_0011645353 /DNA_START=52 /DNA_END=1057 /DNA_ORIENTATION=-
MTSMSAAAARRGDEGAGAEEEGRHRLLKVRQDRGLRRREAEGVGLRGGQGGEAALPQLPQGDHQAPAVRRLQEGGVLLRKVPEGRLALPQEGLQEDRAAKAKAEERRPSPPSEERDKKGKEEEKVVETEENLTWYRHREWKPQEGKQEFKPTQISDQKAQEEAEAAKPAAGSAWNKAGTWEDKDVTERAQKTLKERLGESLPSVDVGGGSLSCEGVDAVEGDASKPVIRGKQRHIFDLSFKVKYVFKWMESDGQRQAKGEVEVSDFTNDTFTEGVLTAPVLRISFSDSSKLEAARRKAVEAALGASSWPPDAGTLMHGVAAKMQQWAKEYEQDS